MAQLEASRLLSDERYATELARVRRARGFGPLRIEQELARKGVAEEVVARLVDPGDPEWIVALDRVRAKRFGRKRPKGYADWARQARFLQYRGFTLDQIRAVMDPPERD